MQTMTIIRYRLSLNWWYLVAGWVVFVFINVCFSLVPFADKVLVTAASVLLFVVVNAVTSSSSSSDDDDDTTTSVRKPVHSSVRCSAHAPRVALHVPNNKMRAGALCVWVCVRALLCCVMYCVFGCACVRYSVVYCTVRLGACACTRA
jgi:hypothetical protein